MLFVHLMFPFDFALFFLPLSLATIGDASPFVHVSFVRLPFVMPFFSSSFLFAELVLSFFFYFVYADSRFLLIFVSLFCLDAICHVHTFFLSFFLAARGPILKFVYAA